jgi:hypothetical protein
MGARRKSSSSIEQHAAQFAVECLLPGGEAELKAIRDRCGAWCRRIAGFPQPKSGRRGQQEHAPASLIA